jgi:hypothetical protein
MATSRSPKESRWRTNWIGSTGRAATVPGRGERLSSLPLIPAPPLEFWRESLVSNIKAFKRNVRKLKELGLTESLDIGYRLSPRGRALLMQLG